MRENSMAPRQQSPEYLRFVHEARKLHGFGESPQSIQMKLIRKGASRTDAQQIVRDLLHTGSDTGRTRGIVVLSIGTVFAIGSAAIGASASWEGPFGMGAMAILVCGIILLGDGVRRLVTAEKQARKTLL